MEAQEFKTSIKAIKENLKGLNIQLISKFSVRPYNTLKSFGDAILEQEQYCNSFHISQAWTTNGIVPVKSLNQLVEMLNNQIVTAIQVVASNKPTNECDMMRAFGSLD